MFYSFKLYLRNWKHFIPLALVLAIQLFIWVYLAINIKPGIERVFLHYNIIFGVDLLGSWWKIYLFPLAGILVAFINYGLSFFLYKIDKFLSALLSFWALFFHFFLLAVIILLVRLNL